MGASAQEEYVVLHSPFPWTFKGYSGKGRGGKAEDLRETCLVVWMVILPSGGLPPVDRHGIHLYSGPFSYMRQELPMAGQGRGNSSASPSDQRHGYAEGTIKIKAICH